MRLIDADVLHSALNKMQKWVVLKDNYHNEGYSYDQVHFTIDNAPTVDTERHGHWMKENEEDTFVCVFKCSLCGDMVLTDRVHLFKYCPHCGAKMDEVEEDE